MKLYFILVLSLAFACKPNMPTVEDTTHSITYQNKQIFEVNSVFASNKFDGARLNAFVAVNDSTFKATIHPENQPINSSPWFAFKLWTKERKNITIQLEFPEFKPRYIPKLSTDGIHWNRVDSTVYFVDTLQNIGVLKIESSPNTLWISAQEVISSGDVNKWFDSLAQIKYVHKSEVGKSVLNRPINMLRIDEGSSNLTLVLIGRQHPPEIPGASLALNSFVKTLLSNDELSIAFRDKFNILLYPLLNPDGVDLGHWRHNANGIDLNRDWKEFSQPETKIVKNSIEELVTGQNLELCFAIDFHTSYSGPYLLTKDTIGNQFTDIITKKWISEIQLNEDELPLDIRPRSQELPYCYNWFFNQFDCEAVTYEEGDEIDRNEVHSRAQLYAQTLMETLLEQYKNSPKK